MKVGILSDSHDNVPALAKAVGLFNDLEVELVIHAGDIIAPFMAKPLDHLQANFIAVFKPHLLNTPGISSLLSPQSILQNLSISGFPVEFFDLLKSWYFKFIIFTWGLAN